MLPDCKLMDLSFLIQQEGGTREDHVLRMTFTMSTKMVLVSASAFFSPLLIPDLSGHQKDTFTNASRSSDRAHTFHAATALL